MAVFVINSEKTNATTNMQNDDKKKKKTSSNISTAKINMVKNVNLQIRVFGFIYLTA